MIASKKRICFAINCPDQSLHIIEMYDTHTLNKYTHTYSVDHHDTIVDLAVCSSIGIFVSVGKDETVRFWDEANTLLAILRIFCSPSCICFSNDRADIFISFGEHLFYIEALTYLPNIIAKKLLGISMIDSHKNACSLFYGPLDKMTSIGLHELRVTDRTKQHEDYQTRANEDDDIFQNLTRKKQYYYDRFSGRQSDLQMLIDCTHWVRNVRRIGNICSSNRLDSWKEYFKTCCSPTYELNIQFDDMVTNHNRKDEGILF